MPSASSSRRRVRKPSPDQIEEDEPSQPVPVEDVDDDEEEQPRRRKSKLTTEKKPVIRKGKGRAPAPAEADDHRGVDSDEDQGERIDVENFHDQPLQKADATRILNLSKDWGSVRQAFHAFSFQQVKDIAMALVEAGDHEEAEEELEIAIRELVDIDEEMLCHEQVISEINQQLLLQQSVNDVLGRYDKSVDTRLEAYCKKTTRQKYAKHEEYIKFKECQFSARDPDTPMPPVTTMIPKEPGDVSDEDDDVEIGGVTQDYKCPLTMMPITDPLTSSVCGHSYSAAAVRQYLGGNRVARKKCPASGCNKWICQNDLKEDKELEKRVKARARRHEDMESGENNTDDEVIE